MRVCKADRLLRVFSLLYVVRQAEIVFSHSRSADASHPADCCAVSVIRRFQSAGRVLTGRSRKDEIARKAEALRREMNFASPARL